MRLKKIEQKGPELDMKQQFYTKSTPQNPMSWSVFPDYEDGRSFKLILKVTIVLIRLVHTPVHVFLVLMVMGLNASILMNVLLVLISANKIA